MGTTFGTDDPINEVPIMQFYDAKDFADSNKFNDLPLPRPAEKAHLTPQGTVPDRVKWQYHYLQTFFGGGSHYIVCSSAHIDPPIPSSSLPSPPPFPSLVTLAA